MPRRASATAAAERHSDAAPDARPSARELLAALVKRNPRHALFCQNLVADPARNATEAYVQAFSSENRDSACTMAPKLMQRPEIVATIEALDRERIERLAPEFEASADRTLLEIARLAYSDIRTVAEWDADGVRFKPSAELTDDQAAAIASVEQVPTPHGVRVKVKLHDKPGSLRMMGDHLASFWAKQQVEHSGTVTLADLLAPPKEPAA